MKHSLLQVFIIVLLLGTNFKLAAQNTIDDATFEKKDIVIADNILDSIKKEKALSMGDLIIKTGKILIGTSYVAHTLENGVEERMIINLREFDCTTFAENCLALARTAQSATPDFDTFVKELKSIRYRNGMINDYTSRLHYFSDWIYDNEQKGHLKNISCEINNMPVAFPVSFMSKHPDMYKQLAGNRHLISEIAAQEKEISKRKQCFIPKDEISTIENQLKDGDILGITTNIGGMDIQHVALAIRQDGRIHILHDSQKYMKVIISSETLEEYLRNNKSATGIVVARPL
ncbi:MAG: N-acetylmuramoyl-L-alanine amidase-like domain-containing protein [Paludibacter sp.]